VKRKPFVVKCENLRKEQVTKREREKLVKLSHTLGRYEWIVINFASKHNLQVEGLNLHKNLSSLPTSKEVVIVFNKRQQNG
jgi:hypothetical protein